MNPEIKTLWLNALRSGDYTKGTGQLYYRTPEGEECHCALGVLAEEAHKAGVTEINPTAYSNGRFTRVSDSRLIPDEVVEWAGFGEFDVEEAPVARINDDQHKGPEADPTFETVANFIEGSL